MENENRSAIEALMQEVSRVGEEAETVLAADTRTSAPRDHRESQAWELASGTDETAFQQMMRRQGLYAPWSGIDDGWVPLVDKLISDLRALGWDGSVQQVKEKYGGLRFYYSHTREEFVEDQSAPHGQRWVIVGQTPTEAEVKRMDRLVRNAEKASFRTCARCGAPGVLRTTNPAGGGWYFTACERHGRLGNKKGYPVRTRA